jgi:hypothetical protein
MLIIPMVMAVQVPGIHFGAPQGRNVHDISYCEAPEHILNMVTGRVYSTLGSDRAAGLTCDYAHDLGGSGQRGH